MRVNIRGKDVEHGAAEGLLFFLVRNVEPFHNCHQVLIVSRIGIHGCKCLCMNFLAVLPVISLSEEMIVAINSDQFRRHHGDTCHSREFIIHHLNLCKWVIVFLGELQQVIRVVRRQHNLA